MLFCEMLVFGIAFLQIQQLKHDKLIILNFYLSNPLLVFHKNGIKDS